MELGHPSEDETQATGLKMGLKMKQGSMQHYKGCGMGGEIEEHEQGGVAKSQEGR